MTPAEAREHLAVIVGREAQDISGASRGVRLEAIERVLAAADSYAGIFAAHLTIAATSQTEETTTTATPVVRRPRTRKATP